ncbi:putative type VI secretion system effector [Pectobacterium sp. B1J-3]|uniref:putative type VI secretion system effector n=1 Tax=Pectobacterium sp. B1J-3 TaxID=3385371 RepID=UPI0039062AA3
MKNILDELIEKGEELTFATKEQLIESVKKEARFFGWSEEKTRRKIRQELRDDEKIKRKMIRQYEEKLAKKRHEAQFGKEETVAFNAEHPRPVLPPTAPLQKLTGKLVRLQVSKARENFADKYYQLAVNNRLEEIESRWGTLGILLVFLTRGAGEASAAASVANQDKSEVGHFVEAEVAGLSKPVRGWLGAIPFEVGETVELVVAEQEDHYEAYAMTRPAERMISVCPRCFMGKWASFFSNIRELFVFFSFCYVMTTFLLLWFTFNDNFLTVGRLLLLPFLSGVLMVCVVFIPFLFFIFRDNKTTAGLAQTIFTTLDLDNPSKINLKKITKARIEEREANGTLAEYHYRDNIRPHPEVESQYLFYY